MNSRISSIAVIALIAATASLVSPTYFSNAEAKKSEISVTVKVIDEKSGNTIAVVSGTINEVQKQLNRLCATEAHDKAECLEVVRNTISSLESVSTTAAALIATIAIPNAFA